jgi:hypothetical protein
MTATYSRIPPSIAPSRFAPNAVVEADTSWHRWAKMTFATKTGISATTIAVAKRGTADCKGERARR